VVKILLGREEITPVFYTFNGNPQSLLLSSIRDEYNGGDIEFAAFSNSTFIICYTCNIDSKLDRSVEGLLVVYTVSIEEQAFSMQKHIRLWYKHNNRFVVP